MKDTGTLVVLCTVPDQETAANIADELVGSEVAACVNIIPGLTSVYRWEGKICRDVELLLICKTTADKYPALEERIRKVHPYDTPEVIALPIVEGSEDYIQWLRRMGN